MSTMTDQRSQVAYYVILIGMDTYQEKPLQGSVRDVQNVKQFLEGLPEPVQIHVLTSTKSGDPSYSTPTQNSTAWLMYKSVTSAIEQVTLNANAGDYVFIHFSGHGTRGVPRSQFSNHSIEDLVLVLDRTLENKVRYLWGPTLTIALNGDGSTQPASSAARDISMVPNWLINPDGYAIITACGPNELAREIEGLDNRYMAHYPT